jgi:hypothetical protein
LTSDLDAALAEASTQIIPAAFPPPATGHMQPEVPSPRAIARRGPAGPPPGQETRWDNAPPVSQEHSTSSRLRAVPLGFSAAPRLLSRRVVPDRLADLVLTAGFLGFAFRSAIHNRERLARALACALLAELALDGHIAIESSGHIHPRGHDDGADRCAAVLLHALRDESEPLTADIWLRFVSGTCDSTTLVWRRLVDGGVATEVPGRFLRRRSTFELDDPVATDWAQLYLLGVVTDQQDPIPARATVLWRVLTELTLDGSALELPAATRQRLEKSAPPQSLLPLLAALERSLRNLSTQL